VQSGFLLVLLGAALVPSPRARSGGALAAMAAGLALAMLPRAMVPVEAALLTLAIVLAAGALAGALGETVRRDLTVESLGGAGALGAGALALAWTGRAWPGAPRGAFVTTLLVIAGAGAILMLVGRQVRLPPSREHLAARPRSAVVGLVLGAIAVAIGPHVAVVFLGVIAAAWSGWRLQRAAGGSGVPVAPALTLLLLPAYRLMDAIAGPEGLGIAVLGELPLSPAAERLLAPALLLAAWAVAGLWPLHRQQPGPFTAGVGVLLLARIVLPAMPAGVEHWRALVLPIVVIGLWHAALSARWSLVGVAMAWVGVMAPGRGGMAGAGLLVAGALLIELAAQLGPAHLRRAALPRVAAGLAAGWGAVAAVESSLYGEVVYTVVAIGGLVAAAGGWAGRQAMTASEPRNTAPSA
jgi:hypothetical protein